MEIIVSSTHRIVAKIKCLWSTYLVPVPTHAWLTLTAVVALLDGMIAGMCTCIVALVVLEYEASKQTSCPQGSHVLVQWHPGTRGKSTAGWEASVRNPGRFRCEWFNLFFLNYFIVVQVQLSAFTPLIYFNVRVEEVSQERWGLGSDMWEEYQSFLDSKVNRDSMFEGFQVV